MSELKVFVGYDPREQDGYDVTEKSLLKYAPDTEVYPIVMSECIEAGLYNRPTSFQNGHLYDDISDAPMATEFALTRFLVPWLPRAHGAKWALFVDCDVMFRCDVNDLLQYVDDKYAIMCVKHDVDHGNGQKMDGCQQTSYPRKNWSSVMLWNLDHPANTKRLDLSVVNSIRGLHLHQFKWLFYDEIGSLPKEFNHLVGVQPNNTSAKIVHYTLGLPSMPGYENCEYSQEWCDYRTITKE